MVFLQVVPSVIYLAAQVIAIKKTFNSVFDLNPDSVYPVIIIMILILVFEWLGGLNSIALTDAVQAVVMILSFIILPLVMVKNFGGWRDLDPETYPKPQFYQTPTKANQWELWQFAFINFSFFTLPHFVQRIYAAKDLTSLKVGFASLTVGPWISGLVGVFIGTVGVTILVNEDGTPKASSNPFTDILEQVMNLGGFAKGAGVIAITAALAAIMSTADSLIIAISQLVTVEIIYPLRPNSTPNNIAWYGRITSLVSVAFALLIG
jgi:Na+/proline symporter